MRKTKENLELVEEVETSKKISKTKKNGKGKKFAAWFMKMYKAKPKAVIGVVVVLSIIIVLSVAIPIVNNSEATVDTEYMMTTLSKSSELTTAKLHYTGFTEFEDEGVIIWDRADFKMVYKATARVGINLNEVKITSDDIMKKINIQIPKAVIQDVKVDASSIKYYDEDFALFNLDEKEDANKAIALAEKKALEEAGNLGAMEMADNQAGALIKGLIAHLIPDDYTVEVKQITNDTKK